MSARIPTLVSHWSLCALVACALWSPGCVSCSDSECKRELAMDCFCCGKAGWSCEVCLDLQNIDICRSVAPTWECYYGSQCEYDTGGCDDVCLEQGDESARCGLGDLTFNGAGGLAAGYSPPNPLRGSIPTVMTSSDYGITWVVHEIQVTSPACEGMRLEQILFADAERGWMRAVGEGDGCAPGLWKTEDGGATWTWHEFPQAPQGGWAGGGRLHLSGSRLFSGGLPLASSRDGGETWTHVGPPVDDWPTGTMEEVEVVGFGSPSGEAGPLCVSSSAPQGRAAVYCGPGDGTDWTRTFSANAPILALFGVGWTNGRAWALLGGDPAVLYQTDNGGGSWREYGQPIPDAADDANYVYVEEGAGFLVLKLGGVVGRVYWCCGFPWDWHSFGAFEQEGLEAFFFHTETRLWGVSGQGNGWGTPSVKYTPRREYDTWRWQRSNVEGWTDAKWTGVVVGIAGDPVGVP